VDEHDRLALAELDDVQIGLHCAPSLVGSQSYARRIPAPPPAALPVVLQRRCRASGGGDVSHIYRRITACHRYGPGMAIARRKPEPDGIRGARITEWIAWSPLVPQALEHGKNPYRNPQGKSEDARPDDGVSRAGGALPFQRVGNIQDRHHVGRVPGQQAKHLPWRCLPLTGLQLAHRAAGLDVHPPPASVKQQKRPRRRVGR
jgi:hypothetical protein